MNIETKYTPTPQELSETFESIPLLQKLLFETLMEMFTSTKMIDYKTYLRLQKKNEE
ncbi:MAG: hypothetical protein K2I82_04430 [Ruminococcus sp.]|nr:hypothetical protein [Ruminococcus sp.]